MIPNWSKAPEWADKHGFASDNSHAVWLNNEKYCYVDERQYGRVFSFAGREGWCIEEIKHITLRPTLKEWSGIGDPPIGALVEYRSDISGPVLIAEVIGVEDGLVAIKRPGSIKVVDLHGVRPVRTQNQIKSEERVKAAQAWLDGIAKEYGADVADTCEDIMMAAEARKKAQP